MSTGEIQRGPSRRSPLRWHRTVATGFAILFLILGVRSAAIMVFHPSGMDFLDFWAAGRLVLQGHPELSYNIAVHGAVENTVAPISGRMPFPYPPPFLAVVTPFSIPSFVVGFIFWVALTAGFYALIARRVAPLSFAFGIGPAFIDLVIGQNGFLICGIFVLGLSLVSSAPFTAGVLLGLMILKPQLALLLPVAMLAGKQWQVVAGAIVSSVMLLLLGLILFGFQSYEGFWNMLPHYVDMLRDSREPWNELASPFALARFAGVPQTLALWIHSIIAMAAIGLTARAWWLKLDERVAILAAATMLTPPYFFTYDALLIIVPIGWLVQQNRQPYLLAFVWLCCFIPIITYFSPWIGPNYISLAALACLWALHSKPTIIACGEAAASGAQAGHPQAI